MKKYFSQTQALTFLTILILGTSCNGQVKKDLPKEKVKEIIWNYAIQNPNSYITAFEASSYFTEKEDLQKLKSIFNKMSSVLQKWYYSQKIKKHLQENNFKVEK